jgi:AraC-like DNA-binding protein
MRTNATATQKEEHPNWAVQEDIPQNSNLVRQQILKALRTQILPWLSNQQAHVVLAEPPIMPTSGVKILGYRPPLPKVPRLKPPSLHECIWPKKHMAAARYIGMGCVLEGEADLALGTNISLSAQNTIVSLKPGVEILTFSQRTLFVLPPGVPRTTGDTPHWERPAPDTAYSRIFWVLFLPSVVCCHICSTHGTKHGSDGVISIEDRHLEPIAQAILEELHVRSGRSDQVIRHLLLGLLWRLENNMASSDIYSGRQVPLIVHTLPEASLLVRNVCQFIQQHRRETLTLSGLASRFSLSPSQLNRRFHTEIGMSVIEYLIHCRLEVAKHLLADVNENRLTIQEIGNLAGFTDPSYFGRAFKKRVGISPAKFREHHLRLAQNSSLTSPM